jgi:hypothetical protein
MITLATRPTKTRVPAWHATFLAMLPTITQHASIAFRHVRLEAKQEAVQEVIANCLVAFCRLYELGKLDVVYVSALARYGVAQVRSGRRVGGKLNIRDISSRHCQQAKCITVERLDHYDRDEGQWKEILVEDKRATPAEVAGSRIDFGDWLTSLTPRMRRVARTLATGEETCTAAKKFGVVPGRISQFRRELKMSWEAFHGEQTVAATG